MITILKQFIIRVIEAVYSLITPMGVIIIYHFIISVGTSILTNALKWVTSHKHLLKQLPTFSKILKEYRKIESPIKQFLIYFDSVFSYLDTEQKIQNVTESLVDELFSLFKEQSPGFFSAELNTFLSLNPNLNPDNTKITLLASDTPSGDISARVIQRFFLDEEFPCQFHTIPDLSYDSLEHFQNGLIAFTNRLIATIEAAQLEHEEVGLIVTGGFKAQIVYSAIIAMLYQIPLIYYNELFRNVFLLPPLPLKLDRQFWNENKDNILWFKQPRTPAAIRKKMKSIPPSLAFFLETIDTGEKTLSPFGKVLLQLYESSHLPLYT
ncbi:MAG: putative CRISPR-associated protein [Candidatus Helarchaeota archaeon]